MGKITDADARTLLQLHGLNLPEDEVTEVAVRLSSLFQLVEIMESEIGKHIDETDPVSPVYDQR
jgi:hypothetical protein